MKEIITLKSVLETTLGKNYESIYEKSIEKYIKSQYGSEFIENLQKYSYSFKKDYAMLDIYAIHDTIKKENQFNTEKINELRKTFVISLLEKYPDKIVIENKYKLKAISLIEKFKIYT